MTNHFNTRETPQSKPIPGREADMKENSAGGFSFKVDCWTRLQRFLILGSEGGSYYASEQKLTEQNAKCVLECLQKDGKRTVDLIVDVSDNGRAVKNTPALFALAMACKLAGDDKTKAYAYKAVSKVARIGTHLFQFTEAIKAFGGFSSGFQRAVGRWYLDRNPQSLALQVVKYQAREGWSHADLLRLAKPKVDAASAHGVALGWATGKVVYKNGEWIRMESYLQEPGNPKSMKWREGAAIELPEEIQLLEAFEQAKSIGLDGNPTKDRTGLIVNLISDYRLPREAIPTQYLNEVAVWDALLDNGGHGMPMTAMIRNLPKMTSLGLLTQTSAASKAIVARLKDEDALRKARVHPLSILVAMRTYGSGHGVRGSLTWSPVRKIVDGLDAAFYKAFKTVDPTGKRWLLALDVSGSMSAGISGLPGINCREASTAMAMVTAAVEEDTHIVGFTSGGSNHFSYAGTRSMWGGDGVSELDLSPRRRLDDNVNYVSRLGFGGTDCALPMIYALERGIEVDVFAVYTDSETWAGQIQPVQALQRYRKATGIPAKLIVLGMASNGFSIADPKDAGMLDLVGMDTSAPAIMSEFALGNL